MNWQVPAKANQLVSKLLSYFVTFHGWFCYKIKTVPGGSMFCKNVDWAAPTETSTIPNSFYSFSVDSHNTLKMKISGVFHNVKNVDSFFCFWQFLLKKKKIFHQLACVSSDGVFILKEEEREYTPLFVVNCKVQYMVTLENKTWQNMWNDLSKAIKFIPNIPALKHYVNIRQRRRRRNNNNKKTSPLIEANVG